jgi:hypothetical protein
MKTLYQGFLVLSLLGLCQGVQSAVAPALPGPEGNGALRGSVSESQQTEILLNNDLSGARVFPNPWRSDRHRDLPVTFDRLSTQATVKIFTLSGHHVKTLETDNGTISWDRANDSGELVSSGVYLYLITNEEGQETKGKLALIR